MHQPSVSSSIPASRDESSKIMNNLLQEISRCKVCESHLKDGVRPVITAHSMSKLLIVGQAPGLAVHRSGIPWDDKSGDNLRNWLQVEKETFYNPAEISILPMGFCYPGKGKSGDLPPRRECAPLWHSKVLNQMHNIQLILLTGSYAQAWYLGNRRKSTLTDTVRNYQEYLPEYFVLPHPSPRNSIWQRKNPWFHEQVIPVLRKNVKNILALK